MSRIFNIATALILGLLPTGQIGQCLALDEIPLKGPIRTQGAQDLSPNAPVPDMPVAGNGFGGLAPGTDNTMTQDMILVSPDNPQHYVGKALTEVVGSTLTLKIDRSDIIFDKLRGVMITVVNATNRPIVIDGEQAKALVGGKSYNAVPVAVIQQAIQPHLKLSGEVEALLTNFVPAAVTVGAAPTIRDFKISRKPILERYGPDELRRKVEYSRFGRRILWTQQKMQGILYFQTTDVMNGVQIQVPASTLFDTKDMATLSSTADAQK